MRCDGSPVCPSTAAGGGAAGAAGAAGGAAAAATFFCCRACCACCIARCCCRRYLRTVPAHAVGETLAGHGTSVLAREPGGGHRGAEPPRR